MEVEAADLSQLTIQDRKVVSARVVGVALFIKFEEAEGKTWKAYRLSTSLGLSFAHFGALAGVGKGQRVSTAFSCEGPWRF